MTTATAPRKSFSILDYPEHLNPFREDDNHNKIKFWSLGSKRLNRSSSINFSGIKELKNSWAFRSFMKKGKKKEPPQQQPPDNACQQNGGTSPIVFRRALQYSSFSTGSRSTVGAPERYVHGGSVTPLPRSRFQERLRSSSQHEVSSLCMTPRMARSEFSGSQLSVESRNPFDDVPPVPPVRASRRKKKKAPLPPQNLAADTSITSETSELQTSGETSRLQTSVIEENKAEGDFELEDMKLNIELKIVEDEDVKTKEKAPTEANEIVEPNKEKGIETVVVTSEETLKETRPSKTTTPSEEIKNEDSEQNVLESVSFPKVDITKYRRNSSVNEDDIRLRRGNLEDFHVLTNKRSKSLTNALDVAYVTYDINLNETDGTDTNCSEEPQKVVCKIYEDMSRKQSIDTVSSTEREFLEIDKVRREFESEINKLNAALEEDFSTGARLSVSDIKRKFDNNNIPTSPNPIPKPRRSNHSEPVSPVNGNTRM